MSYVCVCVCVCVFVSCMCVCMCACVYVHNVCVCDVRFEILKLWAIIRVIAILGHGLLLE